MNGPGRRSYSRSAGVLLCCASALCFGLLGPFAVKAFARGLSINTVIGWRFGMAAAALWLVVLVSRRAVGRGRALWQPLLMGAVLYAGQTTLYFSALQRLPVGLTALLLYTMPVMVVVVAMLTGRESPRLLTFLALGLSVGGVAIALVGPSGAVSVTGVLFGLGSAVVYTLYYFGMDSLPDHTDRLAASALICSGAALAHVGVGVLRGRFDPSPDLEGLTWVVAMALICTVAAISLLMVGIQAAGATSASVVSCLEPISAVLLGAVFFADPFGLPQQIGTAAVVAAVVILGARSLPDPNPHPEVGSPQPDAGGPVQPYGSMREQPGPPG